MPETLVVTTKTFRREKSLSAVSVRHLFFNTKSKYEPNVEVHESEEQIIHAWTLALTRTIIFSYFRSSDRHGI